jgi:hypothetical protein
MRKSIEFLAISTLVLGLAYCTTRSAPADNEANSPSTTPVEQEVDGAPAISVGEVRERAEQARKSGFAADAVRAVSSQLPGRYNDDFNTESYDHISENVFLATAGNPLSTFSIDVDRASYSNIRRFITNGQRPPIDAVRIEEMINYFTYDYAEPSGHDPFSITTEVTAAPWNSLHKLVRIGIQGRRVDTTDLPPSNLVFLIDVSGSMQSSDKLPLLKSSFQSPRSWRRSKRWRPAARPRAARGSSWPTPSRPRTTSKKAITVSSSRPTVTSTWAPPATPKWFA